MIVFVVTLSSAVSAHPGHGNYYPEPVTSDDTSGSDSSSTGTTSSGSGSGSGSTGTTSSGSGSGSTVSNNIGHTSSSNQAENVDSGLEPVENESNETKNSTSSKPEDNYSWGNIALVGLLVTGLAVFGFLYKRWYVE